MSLTPDNRWKTPFCVNIFMLIGTTNAELSNRLISSALSNVLFERPKKPVPAHNTGCFTVQNSPFQLTIQVVSPFKTARSRPPDGTSREPDDG